MRGQKRVLKGVHARLRRAMDARERAYDPRIHRKEVRACQWLFILYAIRLGTRQQMSMGGVGISRLQYACRYLVISTFAGSVPTAVEKSMNFWNSALCLSVSSPAM